MRLGNITQQPGERKWYSIDYSEALDPGDGLSRVLSVEADDPALTLTSVMPSEQRVRIQVSGGVNGTTYKVTVRAETAAGEIWEDELIVRIKEV